MILLNVELGGELLLGGAYWYKFWLELSFSRILHLNEKRLSFTIKFKDAFHWGVKFGKTIILIRTYIYNDIILKHRP